MARPDDAVTPHCDAPGARLRGFAWSAAAGAVIAFTALPAAAQVQLTQHLIVVSSGALTMYEEAVDGLRTLPATTIEVTTLGPDNSALSASIAHASHDTAVVTLGNRAGEFLAQLPAAPPVIHCMAVGDMAITESGLDVPLAIPISVEALWLRRLLPNAHVVAILYSPSLNEHAARTAAAELTALGFTAITQAVAAPEGLPQALRNIAKADVLLAIPDAEIYTPELARGLLLFSYRTHTPLVAYSQAWVRDGALYGLEWRYKELGNYCGALALAALASGGGAARPPMPDPRVIVNLRIAAQLNVDWKGTNLSGVEKVNE
jgi:putative tryptophan/tyrosine transport system substrate-binding protein